MKNLNKILMALVAAGALVAIPSVQADTVSDDITVSVTLNTSCSIGTPTALTTTYTANQAGAAVWSGGAYSVTCTNGVVYTMAIGGTSGTTGTLLGLNYSLALSSAGSTGTGSAQNYSVIGTMAGSQTGSCGSATCNASSAAGDHTVVVTY